MKPSGRRKGPQKQTTESEIVLTVRRLAHFNPSTQNIVGIFKFYSPLLVFINYMNEWMGFVMTFTCIIF